MTCLLMLTLLVQVSAAPLATARHTQPPAPSARARTYVELLETYQRGDPDRAIDELRSWRVADAESRSIPRAMVARQTTRTLLAIALLHTEVMLNGQSGNSPSDPQRAFAQGHLQLARRAIDVLKTRTESDHSLSAFCRSWLIVATSFGLSIDFIPPPGSIPVSSGDGELLLLAGSVAEALATDPILRRDPSVSRVAVLGSSGRDSSVQLLESEQKFRAALRADLTLVEARVRLGSVLAAKGQLDAARRELELARKEAPPGPLAYLAALLLGRVHERAGRFQDASDCYQAAIREYPSSQTSYLALARVIEEQGDTSRAWQTVRTMLQQPEPEDPWWGYWYAQYWQIDNRVMKLRTMVRQ